MSVSTSPCTRWSSVNSLIISSKSSMAEVEIERDAVTLVLRVFGGVFTTGLKLKCYMKTWSVWIYTAANSCVSWLPLGDSAGFWGCRDTRGGFPTLSEDRYSLEFLFQRTGTRTRVYHSSTGNSRADLSNRGLERLSLSERGGGRDQHVERAEDFPGEHEAF